MVSSSLQRYLTDLEDAEKKKDYQRIIVVCLEIVSYLPTLQGTQLFSKEKIINITGYLADFLTVLQEKDEILNLQIAFNIVKDQYGMIDEARAILDRAVRELEYAAEIFQFLKAGAASQVEIMEQLKIDKTVLERLLRRAEQLQIVGKKGEKYFLKRDNVNLKDILSGGNMKAG